MGTQYKWQNFGFDNHYWIGTVEDRNDPLGIGRVRVRIHGWHTEDKTLLPTKMLPWALPVLPVNAYSGGVSGVGTSPNGLMVGAKVIGFWADPPDFQQPWVIGVLPQFEGQGGVFDPNSNSVAAVDKNNIPAIDNPTGDGPPWLQLARGEIGQKEIKGGMHNPRIQEYLKACGLSAGDETPWCAGFAKWCLKKSGINVSPGCLAKSLLKDPALEPISKPIYGCIVVLHRPPNPQSGHVGFYVGASGNRIKLLGGNQHDAVNISGYAKSRLAGLRWPKGYPKEQAVSSSGQNANVQKLSG